MLFCSLCLHSKPTSMVRSTVLSRCHCPCNSGLQKLVDKEEMLVSEAENAYDLPESPYRGVKCLLTRFKIPYLSGFADLDSILPEFRAMVQYAV